MNDEKQGSDPHFLERQLKERQFKDLMAQQERRGLKPHPVDECDATCRGLMAETSAPKPWMELSIEEKIERTRDQVKGRENELRYVYERLSAAQRELGRLRRELIDHRHDSSDGGRVMLPAAEREKFLHDAVEQCANSAMDADPAKVYF